VNETFSRSIDGVWRFRALVATRLLTTRYCHRPIYCGIRKLFGVARRRDGPAYFPLCKPWRLCYTQPVREDCFASFLGSSAVEHSTVNRMVAGSNPARGAIRLFFSVLPCSQPFSTPPQPTVTRSLSARVRAATVRHRSHTSAIFWGYQTGYRRPALPMCSFDTPKWQVGDEA
jgi:hypothetical protein